MSKRKRAQSADPEVPEHPPPKCILHTLSISDHGCFTALSSVKGAASDRLQQIHKIRDRRLRHSHDSPHRMQSVCEQIPTTLPTDLEKVSGITVDAISVSWPTSIAWEMNQNKKHRHRNDITPLVNRLQQLLMDPSSHRSVFFVRRQKSKLGAKLRELKASPRTGRKEMPGSKSNHGRRKWVLFDCIDK